MPIRDTVRDAQRRLVALDAAHTKAVARLDHALARRAEVIAEQDRFVIAAEAEVERSVTDMATNLGVELTAHLLGLDSAEVRRLAKADRSARNGKAAR
ncbi:MAG: hypothetical protein ACYDH5_04680 [Acidimicrobiales bacterium]